MADRTIHSKYLFQDVKFPIGYCSPVIIADSLKTPENLGNIIRLADNVGAKKVLFVNVNESIRTSKIKKTASSSYNSVDWEFCEITDFLKKIPKDYELVAIETTSDSDNLYKTKLPSKVAFVVGNEITGISDEILEQCRKIVHIPVLGKNTSLNVSHALVLALFEWQRNTLAY